MPVTFAHPAAVLPLARTRLPFAALAAGSMAPDLPLFVPAVEAVGLGYARTHTLLGVLTIDVALGVALWSLWRYVVAAPLIDATPTAMRRRLPRPVDGGWLVLPAALIGAATHVGWDEFTHTDRWGVRHVPWLAAQHGPLIGARWAQYASGVAGLLILAVVAVTILVRRTPTPSEARRRPRLAPWVLLAPLLVGGVVATSQLAAGGGGLYGLLYDAVTLGGAATGVTLLVTSGLWHLTPRPPPDFGVEGGAGRGTPRQGRRGSTPVSSRCSREE